MVNESGELVRLTEDDLMMNACALSEAAAMATAAAARPHWHPRQCPLQRRHRRRHGRPRH